MTSKFIRNIKNTYENDWGGNRTSKQYIWDEVEYAKLLIENGKPISNHLFKDVYLLAKYYRHIESLDDETIRSKLEDFAGLDKIRIWEIRQHFKSMIDGAIHGSKKQQMKICHDIKITERELDIINNMVDSTARKIAFMMLCMYKANGNKPFRANMNQITNEIGLNANGEKLLFTFHSYLIREGFIYRYNRRAENRKKILNKMIEVDSQYGELFIPYDSIMYEKHLTRPTRRSNIALWRFQQEYIECEEEPPTIMLPEYYKNMTVEEKEDFKKTRFIAQEWDYYNQQKFDRFTLDYLKENIDDIVRLYNTSDFAYIIGGEAFYSENDAHDKIKVLFADVDCGDGILLNVNDLQSEYDKLLGGNKLVFGNCTECGCKIIKNSNKTKYCDECKVKVRKQKVKDNVQKFRKNVIK